MKQIKIEELLGHLNDVEKKYAPSWLYVEGKINKLHEQPRVSIVGTRNPSKEGREQTKKLVATLVNHGVTLLAGLQKESIR